MSGGYAQSPGGFASPALSQGGEKKGVCIRLHASSKHNRVNNLLSNELIKAPLFELLYLMSISPSHFWHILSRPFGADTHTFVKHAAKMFLFCLFAENSCHTDNSLHCVTAHVSLPG